MTKKKRKAGRELIEAFCTDVALQKDVFSELLTHIKAGYSLDCFGPLSEFEIKECVKAYPNTWSESGLIEAMRLAKSGWESIGRRQAEGTCIGNSRSWYYNMSNRYGWSDKQKIETSGTQALNVSIVSYSAPQSAQDTTSKG
jgi:hypothetical protein